MPIREYQTSQRGLDDVTRIVEQACIDTRGVSEAATHSLSGRLAEALAVKLDQEMELLLFRFETGSMFTE